MDNDTNEKDKNLHNIGGARNLPNRQDPVIRTGFPAISSALCVCTSYVADSKMRLLLGINRLVLKKRCILFTVTGTEAHMGERRGVYIKLQDRKRALSGKNNHNALWY